MTEGLDNMAAVENTSEESCRLIFFRFQRNFGLKNTSFIKGGDLCITIFYSLVHRTDLKLAGLKLDACTMFSLAVHQMLSNISPAMTSRIL